MPLPLPWRNPALSLTFSHLPSSLPIIFKDSSCTPFPVLWGCLSPSFPSDNGDPDPQQLLSHCFRIRSPPDHQWIPPLRSPNPRPCAPTSFVPASCHSPILPSFQPPLFLLPKPFLRACRRRGERPCRPSPHCPLLVICGQFSGPWHPHALCVPATRRSRSLLGR